MRFSEKGLFRWYTDCCKTPAGNMIYSPRCPFAGISNRMFVLQGYALDEAVGKSVGGIYGKYANGGCPPGVAEEASLGVVVRSATWLLGNALTGRHAPSPYWTTAGKPLVEPRILSQEERKKYYR